jgi:hypothetical protein
MSNLSKLQFIAAAALFTVMGEVSAQSGQVFAYPSGGQSQQQQDADRYACHTWSVSQTGFDPTAMPAPQAAPPPAAYASPPPQQQSSGGFLGLGNGGMFKGGGMLGDAATGAALGAAGGALAGNAGKGAAIGALASTVLGVASKSSGSSQPPPPPANYNAYQQQAQMQTQDRQRRQADYNAAFGACMKARNYTVN